MTRCAQAKCRVAETRVCLEGHKVGCPHLLSVDDEEDEVVEPPARLVVSEPRQFYTGEKLLLSEASRFLNEYVSRVVLCAGGRDSGKTTFIARLGEMFRDGSFLAYRFGGTKTICAFERVSWLATVTSGATRPDTRRTERRENDTFFQLCIHPSDDVNQRRHLLLSDLAGETFPTAVASREFCEGLSALARADHLVVFMDCKRLVDPAERHPECDNMNGFLRRVASVRGGLRPLHVQVVFSRWDYITRSAAVSALETFCDAIESKFRARFSSYFESLKFYRIAARPDGDIPPTDDVIQLLFAEWFETGKEASPSSVSRFSKPARDFSAFGLK